jgi:uncharacterized protein with NRDE domain
VPPYFLIKLKISSIAMCTLTFIPQASNNYIITQNRDEFPARAMPGLMKKTIGAKTILSPQDHGGGGNWIGWY